MEGRWVVPDHVHYVVLHQFVGDFHNHVVVRQADGKMLDVLVVEGEDAADAEDTTLVLRAEGVECF